ncbi:MAG: RNA polymerase sigma factor [Roseburia sp.]|nr:RNA polymerase sigma factor [Ruminococcus sp.]MCM1156548.1 RNA polymerase sigma factor [Roseburia sp.]MCM1243374.1 RNA polymerase sigma factor [Roseburia sp.]
MKEEILVEQLKEGSRAAFDALYEKYRNPALHTAYLITGNLADSEDIVQDTFVKIYLHSAKLKNNSGFKAWMMRILVRTAWRSARKKSREIPDEEAVSRAQDRIEPSTLDEVMQREEAERLGAVVKTLPVKQRVVVILFYYNELSVSEIAGMLGIMEGTVKSRLHTARKYMKKALEEPEWTGNQRKA